MPNIDFILGVCTYAKTQYRQGWHCLRFWTSTTVVNVSAQNKGEYWDSSVLNRSEMGVGTYSTHICQMWHIYGETVHCLKWKQAKNTHLKKWKKKTDKYIE